MFNLIYLQLQMGWHSSNQGFTISAISITSELAIDGESTREDWNQIQRWLLIWQLMPQQSQWHDYFIHSKVADQIFFST
jgi:hypothetical protein